MNRQELNNIGVLTPDLSKKDSLDKQEFIKSEKDSVLDMIFAPDPITGLPRNDIGVFLSENTSPQVKEFIQSQLHKDYVPDITVPDGITDEDIEFCTRKSTETLNDYASRMSRYLAHQRNVFNKAKKAVSSKKNSKS